MPKERACIAIDLKSFYASVECVERGLDPFAVNLVVADASRTDKTICLAVSPALKSWGVPGRPRLFEVNARVREINAARQSRAPGRHFQSGSCYSDVLRAHPDYEVGFMTAVPRMALYLEYSTRIYSIYLRHFAPEDILVYSIDEVFLEATAYLDRLGVTARELASSVMREVVEETGITATAGIGTNLYLAKVAMDIVAKHAEPDAHGARVAELDEEGYRRRLWTHRPLTDFWRVGPGMARRLFENGMRTMGDVARYSLHGEDRLFELFGVNAELLIDHAWGWEPCTMEDIRAYRPESRSLSSGQVLMEPYSFEKARVIVREMTEELALDLLEKRLVTDQMVLTVGYDVENLKPGADRHYKGPVRIDHYGRAKPVHAHGTAGLAGHTSSADTIVRAVLDLYDRITDRTLTVRRVTIAACRVIPEDGLKEKPVMRPMSLLTDYEAEKRKAAAEKERLEKERRRLEAVLDIRRRFGKNAILKGTSFEEGATGRSRNEQIGGHKA